MQQAVICLLLSSAALLFTGTTVWRTFKRSTEDGGLRHNASLVHRPIMVDELSVFGENDKAAAPNLSRWNRHGVEAHMSDSDSLFDAEMLHTCGTGQFESRPPELLCRPATSFSQAVNDYIAGLGITDLDFYDVFDESEIYNLFRPRISLAKPPVSFISYDNVTGLLKPYKGIANEINIQRYQYHDIEYSMFFTFWMDNSRIEENRTNEVPFHFNYLPLGISKLQWFAKSMKDTAAANYTFNYLSKLMTGPIWNKNKGLDFFSILGQHAGMELLVKLGRSKFEAGDPRTVDLEHVATRLNLLTYSSIPAVNPCQVITGGAPIVRLRLNKHFPRGVLPSYQYALGSLANLEDTRQFNFWSVAQWNQTLKHQTDVISKVSGHFEPSAILGSIQDAGIVHCERGQFEGCRIEYDQFHLDTYPYTILRSKFGLVLPEPEYLTSPRLMDVIAAGLVPIIVFREALAFALPAQCHVPWRQMAIFLDEEEFAADPVAALRKHVLDRPKREIERILRLLEYYRDDILFTMLHTRVPANRLVDLAVKCVPESFLVSERGLSKTDLKCEFEDFTSAPSFINHRDEDDTPPWQDSWFPEIKDFQLPKETGNA
eukprot:Gregarina_sp_Poly_1__6593@NODE_353_length_9300_cov_96_781761_g295_i0_p2_GENE_NODE_353_length_9300_cov_96_781761_g295_i0NODE_353_length_9300_cov_96_781761_g295_i0_p2_ORF_typecomplete_len601_score67_65Exostosin/PF03016_15/6_4e11_NODE_353_length_9300_cov_96_781761_g295_i011072909